MVRLEKMKGVHVFHFLLVNISIMLIFSTKNLAYFPDHGSVIIYLTPTK